MEYNDYKNRFRDNGFRNFNNKEMDNSEERDKDLKTGLNEENTDPNVAIDGDFAGDFEDTQAEAEVNTLENQLADLQKQLEKEKKEYLFLAADFDNYRKRTLKEKAEIIKNGGENVLKGLLPIVDDFERGLKASENSEDAKTIIEGMTLIYSKLVKYLESMGVKEMQSTGSDFNPDLHEAIAQVPAPADDLKGKVLDTVQKGYMINDKVLRHAKVAVAQ